MANASTAGGPQTFDARALVRAAGEGDAARVESLLAAGADVNAALEGGETALIRAASKGQLEVVRLLLAVGADANVEREDGFTALSVAVFFGYADIVRALLAGGADPSAKGRLGANVEKWAQLSGHGEVAELLRDAPPKSEAGKPVLFPAEGTFSPVVPLSEIDASSSVGVRGAGEFDEDARRESQDQEVATVVRARAPASRASLPARAARPEVPRQGWPLTLLLLGVSLFAGVLAGTYLVRSKWASSEPTTTSSSSVDSQTAPAEARLAEPSTAAAPPESAPRAPVETAAAAESKVETAAASESKTDAESKTEKSKDAKPPTRATQAAASEGQRAARAETTPRNQAPAPARAARPSTPAAAQRDRGAPSAGARLITARPRAAAPPPVFSPSPSDKSEKRKVIPWP